MLAMASVAATEAERTAATVWLDMELVALWLMEDEKEPEVVVSTVVMARTGGSAGKGTWD
jgi:hypothetical protein